LAVADMAGSSPALAWHTFSAALAYANEQPNRGSIAGFNPQIVASFCRVAVDEVRRVIQALRELGILLGERIAKWTKRQVEKDQALSPGAARTRKWRRDKSDDARQTALDFEASPSVTRAVTVMAPIEREIQEKEESPSCVLPQGGETTPAPSVIQISDYRQKESARGRSRGSRISVDWECSPEDHAFAGQRGLDPADTAADFRDYWLAESGSRAIKHDWSAAFKHWCRNAERGAGGGGFSRNRNQPPSIIEAARRAMFIRTR